MKKIFLFLLFVSFVLAGCATVKVAMYHKDIHYPATDPKTIEVFHQKPIDRNFIEIGEITVDEAANWDQVDRIFKIKAAEYGGNAVFVYTVVEHPRTYVTPEDCFFSEGPSYFRGQRYPHLHEFPHRYDYFHHYYYCYGYNDVQTVTFLTVVGIVIRYTDDKK